MDLSHIARAGIFLLIGLTGLAGTVSSSLAQGSAVRASLSPNADERRLARIFAKDAERQEALNPINSLYRGERVEPAVLAALYTDALDRRRLSAARRALQTLAGIDRGRLGPEARISFDVFGRAKRQQLVWLQPDTRELNGSRPFNHFGGLHVEFPSLVSTNGSLTYETERDYTHSLALQGAFARVLDHAIVRFRQGLANGIVEPKLTVRNMIGQIDDMLAQPVEDSPFYSPVRTIPQVVPAPTRKRLQADYATIIRQSVFPAYRRLREFLANEYLPAARHEEGLWAMKSGHGLYRQLVARETSLALEPEAIHELGLDEVSRIRREMEQVKHRMGFNASLADFFKHIRRDPQFHPQSRQDLIDGFAAVEEKVARQAPRFFARLPKTPLRMAPYPAFREKYEPGGSYYQGSADGTRAGMFFFNTYNLPSRYMTGITTLYLHEAVPGHHLQISLAQENKKLPDFQRFGGNNAFIEGWALYTETLGHEMGLYDDPMQHWGTLDDEMLRAMRLVVDTGIHAKRWTGEQAVAYMLANSGMSRTDATSEVERYIANPAQALSYKIGALKIQRLRRRAETALGPDFDIRAFHGQVLGSGALPLPVLEAKIDRWIAASRVPKPLRSTYESEQHRRAQ